MRRVADEEVLELWDQRRASAVGLVSWLGLNQVAGCVREPWCSAVHLREGRGVSLLIRIERLRVLTSRMALENVECILRRATARGEVTESAGAAGNPRRSRARAAP